MANVSQYIMHAVSFTFKGNQQYTMQRNQYSVREDDTTTVYKKNAQQTMPEVKQILKMHAKCKGGIVELTGAYPYYRLFVSY